MYGFRKPYTAAEFEGQPTLLGLDYKAALIIAQAIGYACSKLIGVHVVPGRPPERRTRMILSLIGVSWLALLLLAVLPQRLGPFCMLLNGLPLGMIWGLVFSYLEGRRNSEVLATILTSSFILSSGVAKSVGKLLLDAGVSASAMPALVGLMFAPLLLAGMAVLSRTPPRDALDRAARGARVPMDRAARLDYVRRHWVPLVALILGYTMATAVRDLRDNFAPELWKGLGPHASAGLYSATEVPITLVVLAGLASLAAIRDNLRALLVVHAMVIGGALLLGFSALPGTAGTIGPVGWTIMSGTGLYLVYAPFSAILFDRMVAVTRSPANAGFLIYLCDASGYAGTVVLLILRHTGAAPRDWLRFFLHASLATSIALVVLTTVSALWFSRRRALC
ncbi:DUF5690 family protein [Sphingomonas xinjiangensis]|uniref:MFS transporter n=1 Tax=Sphingomonas xinjiangensis TaxID=643568 RepID=A0A840YT02_9SPHN|nr:DUF5690 family protein [Sphingomonas xinjiangensis]MBB5712829.1 hypothetical protein [Sphingomonas xinjiangensis]